MSKYAQDAYIVTGFNAAGGRMVSVSATGYLAGRRMGEEMLATTLCSSYTVCRVLYNSSQQERMNYDIPNNVHFSKTEAGANNPAD